jgi:hypothetical protein
VKLFLNEKNLTLCIFKAREAQEREKREAERLKHIRSVKEAERRADAGSKEKDTAAWVSNAKILSENVQILSVF